MSKTVCFNCGSPTTVVVNKTKPPQFKRYICTEKKCWDAWYHLSS